MDNKEIFERIPFLLREVWWCCEVKGEDRQEVMRRYGISEKTLVSIVTDVSLLMMKHAETKRDIERFMTRGDK